MWVQSEGLAHSHEAPSLFCLALHCSPMAGVGGSMDAQLGRRIAGYVGDG